MGSRPGPDIDQSERALELRKFFAPFDPNLTVEEQDACGFNASIRGDGALAAFTETVLWRLKGVRAMVSLIDGDTQYFLAGVAKALDEMNPVEFDYKWFGCSTVKTPGGLCENTITIDGNADDFPCFEVTDLSIDSRFANLQVVDGTIAAYKFYAGCPIITENGINIGTIFVFDDKPRPGGLSYEQRKCLNQMASSVMRYLETKREAAERKRVAMMSQGIARFLETTSKETEDYENALEHSSLPIVMSRAQSLGGRDGDTDNDAHKGAGAEAEDKEQSIPSTILDKIKLTLDHAAEILQSSLELSSGGVVFLDTALGYHEADSADGYFSDKQGEDRVTDSSVSASEMHSVQLVELSGLLPRGCTSPGQVRSFNDEHRPAKVIASSAKDWNQSSNTVDGKTLQSLISSYPKGNVWYIDEDGLCSSLKEANDISKTENYPDPSGRRRSVIGDLDLKRQEAELAVLSKAFHAARQIIFLPLWDLAGKRWHSGCFVWSESAVPVFTVEADVAYLLAFTNSVMVEISRLDAITANTMKSNFISSISHEFRSPLHGILASSEFMRETPLDSVQIEYVSTIQNCGSTLLDTINHVLDYSKINSFQKIATEKVDLSNGLHETCNIAILCEEVISGMMAATEFKGSISHFSSLRMNQRTDDNHPVEIILDFEHREWNFRIQPGALRRILMNIFGNAQKFTESGFIYVRLSVRNPKSPTTQSLVINVMDSGIGISAEFMQRKLYTPFAQDNSFSTGVGLGLSIVHSIVTQQKGKIHIRSEPGEGTDVEVVLPLHDINDTNDETGLISERADTSVAGAVAAQAGLLELREAAKGMTVAVRWPENTAMTVPMGRSATHLSFNYCLRSYLQDWFGFMVVPAETKSSITPDMIILPYSYFHSDSYAELSTSLAPCPMLLLRDGAPRAGKQKRGLDRNQSSPNELFYSEQTKSTQLLRTVYRPLGPYKLASAILGLFRNFKQVEQNGFKEPPFSQSEAPSSTPANPIPDGTIDPDTSLSSTSIGIQLEPTSLPFRSPPNKRNSAPLPNPTNLPAVGLVILAVDDNDLNLALLHRYLLKRRGGSNDRIVLAKDGIEAVKEARTLMEAEFEDGQNGKGTGFNVIFMDMSMPLMDGFEATRKIRALESQDIQITCLSNGWTEQDGEKFSSRADANGHVGTGPVENDDGSAPAHNNHRAYIVALTGLGSRRDREEAAESGVDEFLTKPVGFARVGEILNRVMDEKMKTLALRLGNTN